MPMLEAALAHAAAGRYVFPLWHMIDGRCACDSPRCDKIKNAGKHPMVRWGKGATRDPAQIRQWWTRWPGAGIGCGQSRG